MKLLLSAIFLIGAFTAPACAAPIDLVRNGASNYVIFFEKGAPKSVAEAATEIQKYVQKATGAKLAIVHQPTSAMISLGDNAASRQAGITTETIPWEGFRIVTKDDNLFLVGRDTADGQRTPQGGSSAGTMNATSEFLEKFVGVRWLMPGEHGDYVPKMSELRIPETDFSDAPFMLNRRVPYTQERRPEVKQWWRRQRLGWSLYLNHGHNWRRTIPASQFEKHPDWFPLRGGVRVPPTGRYKLCTTNPGLVRAFADATIQYFDEHPDATCYSLSPSDSAGYCECDECSALYEKDPNGKRSVTPAILKFYNDVAKLVAKKYPEKILAGYVYAAYLFPPQKTTVQLEPNIFLVYAPSFDYGFTLARPAVRKQWETVLHQWTQITQNISYYDLPVNISTEAGALNPPGLEILKFIYPRLKASKIKGVYVYGIDAWGRAAPLNYLLARLAWNPDADIEAIFDEYCAKAYGAGGDEINRMFRMLDREVARHFREFPNARYSLTTDMMRDIYVRNFAEIEQRYQSAVSKVRDPDARARLEMIGDNLTVLHWNLRQHRLLKNPQDSMFYLSDEDFFHFLTEHQGSLALHPSQSGKTPSYVKEKIKVTVPEKSSHIDPMKRFRLRGDQHLILKPTGATPATVKFSRISSRGQLVTYTIYRPGGKTVETGLVSNQTSLTLDPADADFYHLAISAGTASFMVTVDHAAWAIDGKMSDQGLHLLGQSPPLYFYYVPAGTSPFQLSLEATPPGETAAATLFDPSGRQITEFDCEKISVDRQTVEPSPAQAGWWKLDIHQAASGSIDDVWIKLSAPMSGYFSIDPKQAAAIR